MKLASLLEWACSVITVATVLANSCLWVSLSECRFWITDENSLDKTSRTLENAWKSQEQVFKNNSYFINTHIRQKTSCRLEKTCKDHEQDLKNNLTYFINQEQVFKNNSTYFINQEQVFKNNSTYFINTHIGQNIAHTGKNLQESRTDFKKSFKIFH